SKTLADVAAEPEVNNRHGAAKNAAPKFEPILDPKAQQHFRVAAGSERNEDPAHRELLAVAAKANEKPHIPDQSHPVLSGNTGAFKELEALTS
ncbi:hypothetical protein, partial [Pseudoalteromonas distincta]|uniref:hypothetical protein n=1 Tax=Pseudoalteromonas distincta TaxID=77608 RepID=UPI0034E8934C